MINDVKSYIEGFPVKISSASRHWKKQLGIILNPEYKRQYRRIKRRFLVTHSQHALPEKISILSTAQLRWWEKEIDKQADKPRGFAHVGGNAVDVIVGRLTLEQKKELKEKVEANGTYKVYPERKLKGKPAKYGVILNRANIFHIYKTKTKITHREEKRQHHRNKPVNETKIRADRPNFNLFFLKKRKAIWI